MESRFVEIANTQLSDEDFFEEVFISYIQYLYKNQKRNTFVQDLSRIRQRFNENDIQTQYHLRDKIETVLYRYNNLKRETSNADILEMDRKIEQLEEKLEVLTRRLRG
jgi:hypothetical protein